jgi:hypothetical protein
MANTQGLATSFKTELLSAIHALGTTVTRGATTKDTIKAALFLASATVGPSTTTYTTTGEASGTGYTAGGVTVTNGNAPASSGTTAYWTPSASLSWSGLTLSSAVDAVQLYNSTQGDKTIGVFTFGSLTITAGTLTIAFPVNDSSTGLVRIA